MELKKNFSLKNFNTFGIEVNTRFFAEITSVGELNEVLFSKDYNQLKKIILGGGSNILLTKNLDGLTIKINIPGINLVDEDSGSVLIEIGAGVVWNDVVEFCVDKNWGGIENLILIPGTAGAAPMQNIGAYGQEIKDTFEHLEGVFIESGEQKKFYREDCRFGYRDSIFKNELKERFVITKIYLRLSKKPVPNFSYGSLKDEIEKENLKETTIQDLSRIIKRIRQSKLPDPRKIGNAGSFFKNPVISVAKFEKLKSKFPEIIFFPANDNQVKLAAAWLIEQCGWKGKRFGDAGVHANQPLVLVNYGGAKGEDMHALSGKIKKSVLDKFEIELNEEVNVY